MPTLKVFRCTTSATAPQIATAGSACFDLRADLSENTFIDVFGQGLDNHKWLIGPKIGPHSGPSLILGPLQRAKIPTGLVFDIPDGYSVRLHPRSGIALKQGLTLINAEGVVDSDYVEEVCVAVVNISQEHITVTPGDRICQAELVKNVITNLEEVIERPARKTERAGGFGSTGKK